MPAQWAYYFSVFLFSFILSGYIIRLIMLILSVKWIIHEKRMIHYDVARYPKVSMLIPAFNEQRTIVENVTHAINNTYPDFEIIVVNDGSDDLTLALLIEAFELTELIHFKTDDSIPSEPVRRVFTSNRVKNLIVIDKKNGGKADALNCAINASASDYCLCLDADTVLTANTIKYLIRPMMQDNKIVVTSGNVRILSATGGDCFLTQLQRIEFLGSIALFRTGWNFMNANLIISGALGLFRKETLTDVGGYHNLAIGEDMELTIRIHRQLTEQKLCYKILQLGLPTGFTKPVPSIREMIRQRKRWQKGLMSSLRLNKELLFNRRYKQVGLAALPFYTVFEVWGPFIEITGIGCLIIMAFFSFDFFMPITLWSLGIILGVTENIVALTIDKLLLRGIRWKDYGELCAASIAGAIFYHFIQLYCKVKGATEYIFETRVSTVWDTER